MIEDHMNVLHKCAALLLEKERISREEFEGLFTEGSQEDRCCQSRYGKKGSMIMNKQALFCDGTGVYVIPPEPVEDQKIILRFRTAKDDVQEAKVVTRETVIQMKRGQIKERRFHAKRADDGRL